MFGPYVNHEYGYTLLRAGRIGDAVATFERMTREGGVNKSKGHRSLALLNMYRGKYGAAVEELRRAIVLSQAGGEDVSEFRDRMYLVTTLDFLGDRTAADREWTRAKALIDKLSLEPAWLWRPVRRVARQRQLGEARRLLVLMKKTIGSTTADSSVARNLQLDQAYVNLAQAEIELADGHVERAIGLLEPARVVLTLELAESLALAYAAAGRSPDAIARYEELLAKGTGPANELQQTWLESRSALGNLYEHAARPDDARRMYSALVEQWKDGDANLPLLVTARERLTRLQPR
jgi:tetratricopeptide (TPR) repeat protein